VALSSAVVEEAPGCDTLYAAAGGRTQAQKARSSGGGVFAGGFSGCGFRLDAGRDCACIAAMKTKICALLSLVAVATFIAGCVGTVNDRHTAGFPGPKDKVVGRYERSLDEVYTAARQVVLLNGALVSENILHSQTNAVKTLEGRVNQRRVYVRVEQVDPKLTEVKVQARTSGGFGDVALSHELEKQIALKLVR
jgi:hypothetical protein